MRVSAVAVPRVGFTIGKWLPPSGSHFLSFGGDRQETPGGGRGLEQWFSTLAARQNHLGSLKITDAQLPHAEIQV